MKRNRWGPTNGNETRLDEAAMLDIFNMYHSTPSMKVARDAFMSMTLCAPFEVQIPALNLTSNGDLKVLIETYWMPWLRTVYDWLKMFGVVCYYFKRVRKTDHYYPVVPEYGSGYISTWINDKHEQKWKWYWTHTAQLEEEKTMHWITSNHYPTIHGVLRSPCSTLLDDYRTVKILRESLEVASTQAARPPYLFE